MCAKGAGEDEVQKAPQSKRSMMSLPSKTSVFGRYMINLLTSFRKEKMAGKLLLVPLIRKTHISEILTCGTEKGVGGS